MVVPPQGMDEYQRLMAQRAAQQRRNRMLVGGVVVVAVALIGYRTVQDRKAKGLAQEKLRFGERFVVLDKSETGPFWNCITSSEVDVGMFQSNDQIQKRIESAYFTQQKTFSDHLTTECVPKIERARQAASGLAGDAPAEFKEAMDKYAATLPRLQSGIETYAEKIKGRGATKDIDQLIQDTGNAFHSSQAPTAEGLAFEKFLYCAVPNLDKMKDAQALLEFLADTCYHKDPVAFMNGVREKCGSILTSVDKDAKAVAASKTWKTTMKKFYEEDARQLRAWEDCARKSRKGKKVLDLEAFLVASGEYMEARAGVVTAVKASAAQAAGTATSGANEKK
jgi:hypothetical protein